MIGCYRNINNIEIHRTKRHIHTYTYLGHHCAVEKWAWLKFHFSVVCSFVYTRKKGDESKGRELNTENVAVALFVLRMIQMKWLCIIVWSNIYFAECFLAFKQFARMNTQMHKMNIWRALEEYNTWWYFNMDRWCIVSNVLDESTNESVGATQTKSVRMQLVWNSQHFNRVNSVEWTTHTLGR